jgi:hypothetical protein
LCFHSLIFHFFFSSSLALRRHALDRNRALKGIFPKSYVHLIAAADIEIVKNEYVIKRSEIVDEITTILKEWHEHFKKFFLVSFTTFFWDVNQKLTFLFSSPQKTDKQRQFQSDSREDARTDQVAGANVVGQCSRRRNEGPQT